MFAREFGPAQAISGPCWLYAFDIDNPTAAPMRVQLLRESGSVLVETFVMPYHAHGLALDMDRREYWSWESMPYASPIDVPDGMSLVLEVKPHIDEPMVYWLLDRFHP